MKPITVLLAEDHTVVREGFRNLLNAERDIRIVGEAETGREAVQLAKKLHPTVVIMDIAMPLLNGLEATRQIVQEVPGAHVLILSAHDDDAYVERAIAYGAQAFLLKKSSAQTLSKAIREVQQGHTYFSTAIPRRLQHPHENKTVSKSGSTHLSSREVEVLQLIAEGKANKEIATELGISIKTVEKHRQHLMAKLDIHDTAGLTRYAIAAGIIENNLQFTIL
jgi:DNA-binding NarL/FixJ family response regulator